MSEIIQYQIQQLVDNGQTVQITLMEDVQTEPVSQKQLMMEAINKKLDPELKDQILPFLEAILQAQPTIAIKSYAQTTITIAMPKRRYEKMGSPQVGQRLEINIKKL
ncbi:hypothetical protein DYY67_0633 [Candidatus Nitrosotalea sp. TS]|uniref:hypothetical protein n=1 Tax=Candidatus Nitrosotalea sp. TS TaxID=2341020 RepID=UPI00140D0DE1|nr:hypothetical protein [Candidatus Nitrosotalea sp. TS]NHI02594.1 hypothetical protein [Candidatus Nitrosotalea sp. TS]